MAYRMFLARALQCPTKKAIGSFKLLHFEANVYYFFCCKLCSHVYQLLAYIKHFASFHYETISFPERNTLHAYTHTHTAHTTCHCSFDVCDTIFCNTVAFRLLFYILYLLFVVAAGVLFDRSLCSVCYRELCV